MSWKKRHDLSGTLVGYSNDHGYFIERPGDRSGSSTWCVTRLGDKDVLSEQATMWEAKDFVERHHAYWTWRRGAGAITFVSRRTNDGGRCGAARGGHRHYGCRRKVRYVTLSLDGGGVVSRVAHCGDTDPDRGCALDAFDTCIQETFSMHPVAVGFDTPKVLDALLEACEPQP